MYTRKYIHQTHLNASPERVYRWHDEPSALQRLTPEEDAIDVVKAAKLGDGNQAHLRIPLLGCCLYVDWTAELENVQQGREFSDRQIKGPFKIWKHRHLFLNNDSHGCLMRDEIEFMLPGGRLIHSALSPFVVSKLRKVFGYRHQILIKEFGEVHPELFNEPSQSH